MADLDYDQLDKAVINAMTDAPVVKPEEQPKEPEAPAPAPQPTPPPAPAARRSQGRFMDMMPPASMRSRSAPASLSHNPRQERPTGHPAPSTPLAPSTPDLLERDEAPRDDAWKKDAQSPFLTGAKVEKRPLGDSPGTGTGPLLSKFEDSAKDDDIIDFDLSPEPAVETPSVAPPTPENTSITPPRLEPQPQLEAHYDDAPAPQPTSTPAHSSPQVSIPQQYKEQPRQEQLSGSIYDTESYHQPVAHHDKKRSPGITILWIVLLIALGAGVGAALYFFVLPML